MPLLIYGKDVVKGKKKSRAETYIIKAFVKVKYKQIQAEKSQQDFHNFLLSCYGGAKETNTKLTGSFTNQLKLKRMAKSDDVIIFTQKPIC